MAWWWTSSLPWLVPGCVLGFAASTVLSRAAARWLHASRPVAWVLLMTVSVILAGTLTPLNISDPLQASARTCDLSRTGLPPLDELRWPSDVIGNVLVFVPLGFAIALVPWSRHKAAVLVAAAALPVVIELVQLAASVLHRACESADVADNLTGLVLGLGAGAVVARLVSAVRPSARPV